MAKRRQAGKRVFFWEKAKGWEGAGGGQGGGRKSVITVGGVKRPSKKKKKLENKTN